MSAAETVCVILVFAIAGIMAALSIRSFRERGFLLNNAYLYASKEEREEMDKKPYYRQTAIIFLLLSIIFTIIGLSVILHHRRICLLEIPFIAGAVIYAVVSSYRIGRKE